ncbi:hypothetical protein [Nesterenkonia rhizosphaerae]|uniref:DUF4190 domain-containing protein n=1 Tax=Nesterenkonia rhizosphaerae TaxID=1348272 RepID=A0ABP9G152_9MICC
MTLSSLTVAATDIVIELPSSPNQSILFLISVVFPVSIFILIAVITIAVVGGTGRPVLGLVLGGIFGAVTAGTMLILLGSTLAPSIVREQQEFSAQVSEQLSSHDIALARENSSGTGYVRSDAHGLVSTISGAQVPSVQEVPVWMGEDLHRDAEFRFSFHDEDDDVIVLRIALGEEG